jgi:solute carrier family 25 (mitochondrial phosphate transporter), member 23/24/25/41
MSDSLWYLLIGGCSSIVSRTCTSPLELYRLQKQNRFIPGSSLKHILKNEGVFGFWKGNGVNCMRVFPQYAINYTIYRNVLKHMELENKFHNIFASSFLAGSLSMLCIYPLETSRTFLSLQSNKNQYKNFLDIIKKVPFKNLYGGSMMSIMGFAPWNAISLTTFNIYKDLLHNNYEVQNPNLMKLVCGGFAGMTAISITYPTDLIRRRLQLQHFGCDSVPEYNGIIDCAKKVLKSEGLIGLYRGLPAAYIKTFPSLAIQMYMIDTLGELHNQCIVDN